ncbi:hypothetical protein [Microbacterium testaceum]|uniref:hypothetical protein n=1 Tax=Microbacterium testaceum TaxID=2033 RepID=UPI0022E800AA|nr:hypothetical protein [Microbacterium testaceum]
MILEVERAVDEVTEALRLALVDGMLQDPDADEPIVSSVVPSWADGDVVFLEGAFSLDAIARAIVAHTNQPDGGRHG